MFSFSDLHLHLNSTTSLVFIGSRRKSVVGVQMALLRLLCCVVVRLDFRAAKLIKVLWRQVVDTIVPLDKIFKCNAVGFPN